MFLICNLLEKSILVTFSAVFVFLGFNLLKKSVWVQKIFLFLGKHSTNIWLTHMFFYAVLFKNLVWKAKYPLVILGYMLGLCFCCSYAINLAYNFLIQKIYGKKVYK